MLQTLGIHSNEKKTIPWRHRQVNNCCHGKHHPSKSSVAKSARFFYWQKIKVIEIQRNNELLQTPAKGEITVGRVSAKNNIAQKKTFAETVANYVAPRVAPRISIYPHM